MDEKTEPKPAEAKAEPCCEPEAAKPKNFSKYDYRRKEHGQEATRRKGCC
ncbi:hypothetical protein FBZ83_101754 [Azospirillum brasilense]|uniref:Uncharacterized protein n=1 Tax=Azospirillum brasilense TaxID=192 RepID=A0A560CSQ0_AZOBR|nr:hypothetical protein [Azospirillum brasilense]TWA87885.1 hypothetical protein FBZ83_101754 [Azospirillum brasilense]